MRTFTYMPTFNAFVQTHRLIVRRGTEIGDTLWGTTLLINALDAKGIVRARIYVFG